MFKILGPQKVQHSDGYTVQIADRFTVEYIEGDRKAVIDVDFAPLTGVYQNSLRGWMIGNDKLDMNHRERAVVLDRILAGLDAMGCTVELC